MDDDLSTLLRGLPPSTRLALSYVIDVATAKGLSPSDILRLLRFALATPVSS